MNNDIDAAVDRISIDPSLYQEYVIFLNQSPNDPDDYDFCNDVAKACIILKQTLRLRKLVH